MVHEVAVVGEEDQALGVGVQTARGNQPHAGQRDEIRHLARGVPVAHRGHVARRLVQGDVMALARRGPNGLAVEGENLRVRIDARAGNRDDLAVHGNPTGGD